MAERVAPGGGVGRQHPGADRLVQAPLQVGLGQPGDLGEQPVGHPPAGHRRHPQHPLGRLRSPWTRASSTSARVDGSSTVRVAGPGGQQLLGVERVALGAVVDALHLVRRQRRPAIASRCSASSARVNGASSSRSTPGSRTSSASSGRSG